MLHFLPNFLKKKEQWFFIDPLLPEIKLQWKIREETRLFGSKFNVHASMSNLQRLISQQRMIGALGRYSKLIYFFIHL